MWFVSVNIACSQEDDFVLCIDCGGKMCYNGGVLDVATCQCQCSERPWINSRHDCSCKFPVCLLLDMQLLNDILKNPEN